MGMGWEERTVKVDRVQLLETLKENRIAHQTAYKESVAGYRVAATTALAKQVSKARRHIDDNAALIAGRIDRFDPDEPLANQVVVIGTISFTLEVPVDHTKSYDVAIAMADWSVDETIELTQSQFQCFVLDDWDWKQGFEVLNKSYTSQR
jgi:hypothetical protein